MSDPSQTRSLHLQGLLDRLRAGDEAARREILDGACERLRQLTRTMLRDYRRLRRWEESDDILQNALLRLHRALEKVVPPTPRDFYRLATLQVRRELIDLARHYFGPQGLGARHESGAGATASPDPSSPGHEPAASSHDPGRLAAWAELHERAAALPEEEREVFDLLWYQGLTPAEAAALLGVSARTVKRRWQAACLKLHADLGGEMPGL